MIDGKSFRLDSRGKRPLGVGRVRQWRVRPSQYLRFPRDNAPGAAMLLRRQCSQFSGRQLEHGTSSRRPRRLPPRHVRHLSGPWLEQSHGSRDTGQFEGLHGPRVELIYRHSRIKRAATLSDTINHCANPRTNRGVAGPRHTLKGNTHAGFPAAWAFEGRRTIPTSVSRTAGAASYGGLRADRDLRLSEPPGSGTQAPPERRKAKPTPTIWACSKAG
jgi:hypothetical protein